MLSVAVPSKEMSNVDSCTGQVVRDENVKIIPKIAAEMAIKP